MRILVADNRSKTRFALRTLLNQLPGIEIVGEATDIAELLSQAKRARPHVILLDWRLRGLSRAPGRSLSREGSWGMTVSDLLAALRNLCAQLYVVVLDGRPETRVEALAAGADDFVSKVDPPDRLLAAIKAAFACVFGANSGHFRYA